MVTKALARFQRLTQLGYPRDFPIVQFPNAPLVVSLAAGVVARFTSGQAHADLRAVSAVALAAWAYDELAHGSNWFRRCLGGVFLVIVAWRVAHY